MDQHVIEITTEVFRLLRKRAPAYVSWADEKPGPTQRIVVEDDVYREFIDRAIAKRKTLDQVVRETCRDAEHAKSVPAGVAPKYSSFHGAS
jgi:hypothetical protein